MSLIACPECRKQISDSADKCPHCGYRLTPEMIDEIKRQKQRAERGCTIGCLGLLFVLFIIGILFSGGSGSQRELAQNHQGVENSAWDGSVSQVKRWLKANVKDPGSLRFIEWSPVTKRKDGGFMVRVKYRARNSFGGYVVEHKVFFLDSTGTVVGIADYS